MPIPQFSEMLAEIDAAGVVIDPDGGTEPLGNQCSISVSRDQADTLTTQDIVDFVHQAADLFDAKRHSVAPEHSMIFYCWVDEMAGQLRFSVMSSEPPAFGCVVDVVPELSMIANRFLECNYLGGIPFEELSPDTDGGSDDDCESDDKPFTLDVYILELSPKGQTPVETRVQTTMTFSHAIILDFEATCDDRNPPQPQEVIEFPSVLLSLSTQETVDEFSAFVKPCHHPHLTEFCKNFTSIRQSDVDGAKSFAEVLADHQTWLKRHRINENDAVIVTCGDWDLGTMFPAQCLASEPRVEHIPRIYSRWHNIKHSFCLVTNRKKAPGMAGMMKELGLPLVGHHHRGIDDCRNIAELCNTLLNGGAKIEITSELPPSKYPPITILLRLGDRVEETLLVRRSVTTLARLAGKTFESSISEFSRPDGTCIVEDEDLLFLTPGEVIQLRE